MAEYTVTAIRYCLWKEGTKEERDKNTEEFLSGLEVGTPVVLATEPDNPKDCNAIAVYIDYTRLMGYIPCEKCEELKPLLDEQGLLNATISRHDGHVTAWIEVPSIPESPCPSPRTKRVLPESPLPRDVSLGFSAEERALQVVASLLAKAPVSIDSIGEFIEMAERYMPLSRLSISREDALWRDHILKQLRKACKLKLPEEQRERLKQLYEELNTTIGDFRVRYEPWKLKVFEGQLAGLRAQADEEGGLFERFEKFATQSKEDKQTIIGRLACWLKAMPQAELCDFHDHSQLVEKLNYLGVSRRELYDVYAALLLLERYQGKSCEDLVDKLKPIFYENEQEVKDFLAGIKGMKPKEITAKVNQLVKEGKISKFSCHRDLWKVLHDNGLYDRSESNWNMQVI